MAKAIRKEPLAHKFAKLVEEQSYMLKQADKRTDRLFKIIKEMEITINNQQALIGKLSKALDAANKIIHPFAEKIKKAEEKEKNARKSNS
tara:strand:- start:32 stop:301 length:270 start_codon:yes stop_codon:yes gene_type:complete